MDWKLVRGHVKGLDWNEIIRSSFPASSINEALLRVLNNRAPMRSTVVKTDDKPV